MHPLAATLGVVLPCFCAILLGLTHVLRLKADISQLDADRMSIAYLYVSFGFYALHSKVVKWLSGLIHGFCNNIDLDSTQPVGFLWVATAFFGLVEMASLLPFAYRSLAPFKAAESTLADALSENFELAAWVLSLCYMVVLIFGSRLVPSKLALVRITIVYLILLAAPTYVLYSGRYIAVISQLLGKIFATSNAV